MCDDRFLAQCGAIRSLLLEREDDYCGCGDGMYVLPGEDEFDWAIRLYDIGWRAVDGKLMCEGCVAAHDAMQED